VDLSGLTNPDAVRQAVAEFDQIGREQFLDKYGFGIARAHFLRLGGKYYDSKAIAGAAYGYQHPEEGALTHDQFSGGDATVKRRLNALGFAVTDAPPTTADELRERLAAIKAYQRENYTAPHKAVVLLIVLHRFANDQTSTWPVAELNATTAQLLEELGARTDSSLEPIWRLQTDGVAEITQVSSHLLDQFPSGDPPAAAQLTAQDVEWSLTQSVIDLITDSAVLVDELIELVNTQLTDEQRTIVDQYLNGASFDTNDSSTGDPTRFWGRRPRAWVVRAGMDGADEDFCLSTGISVIGWQEADFTQAASKTDVRRLMEEAFSESSPQSIPSFTTQVWRFIGEIGVGDRIVIPRARGEHRGTVAIGTVTSDVRYVPDAEPTQRHQRSVTWELHSEPRSTFGNLVRFLDAPMTVQILDDNIAERLNNLVNHGSFNLTWWINQGKTFAKAIDTMSIWAPKRNARGSTARHWSDVGRILQGDTIIHYSNGLIEAVSEALTDGHEGDNPYRSGATTSDWETDGYVVTCSYDRLWDGIPITEIQNRTPEAGPFTSSAGVKQGYCWPVTHHFVTQLVNDHAERLRGTTLNPGNIWLFQANPKLEGSEFPQRIEESAGTDKASHFYYDWVVTRHGQRMEPGDRVLYWFSGADAGIYASGLLTSTPFEGDEDTITNRSQWVQTWVNINHFHEPVLKADITDDAHLGDLQVLRSPTGTNFKASQTNWNAYISRVAKTRHHTARPEKPEDVMTLADLTNQLYLSPADTLDNIVELFHDRPQAIFYGPPGTGKTYIARQLADHLTANGGATKLVQFHPSYAYEDFVEGWRPTPNGQFELRDGALKTFADDASRNPDHRYVMVIDEINRANLSKVLGELFFILEYRDETANLQYSDSAFSLPRNLWIIGTMNTADRSIAMVDAALRRRFHFHAFFPTEQPIDGTLRRFLADHHPSLTWVADMVDKANEQLPDRNLGIGPSHFMRPNLTEQLIQRIWTHSILPYIEDNFDYDKNALQPFTYDALR